MKELKQAFIEKYGDHGEFSTFFAPGRVNLIGEHTDYNGGYVFPCALSVGTYAIIRKREDKQINLFSLNFKEEGIIQEQVDDPHYKKRNGWANYPLGVVSVFRNHGFRIPVGFDVAFYGNIPNGAGLSSSASIELVMAAALRDLYQLDVPMVDMVKLAQRAENEFVGVNCGIMDQFAIGMGKKDYAILLNCETLEFQYTPLDLSRHTLIIANTNKQRGLADSKYNERIAECDQALQLLQQHLNIHKLGDITADQFEDYKYLIKDPVVQKRAKHVVYENRRTVNAVDKLNAGDIESFGRLMNESHVSLRDDYEVTGKELDALTEAAWKEGAIGSRMTGAGFGGCTINIVNKRAAEDFVEHVGKAYKQETGLEAEFYVVEIGDGAKRL
ncbi:galactokinase [Halobacillus rhizosphaerae]|uniref:galactokinase n=1 Tax=Halobacillus rhizosphaerae TaxID=3064889 RepID=UPI00398AB2A3